MGREAYHCSRRLKVPLVGTHHTFFDQYLKLWHLDYRRVRYLSWQLTNRYYNHCDVLVSPTRVLAETMKEHGLRVPVEIIPNPVPLSDFRPREERQDKEHATIAYMGRLSREKDVGEVLEAFAHVLAREAYVENGRAVHLVLIGDGPYRRELEEKAASLGISDLVTFTGFLRGAALAEEVRAHDVFVTASRSENMPVSVLKPWRAVCRSSPVSALGMPEIVRHGENGFLVTLGDTEAMAAAILGNRSGQCSAADVCRGIPRVCAPPRPRPHRRAA